MSKRITFFFQDYCLSTNIRTLVIELGWKHPVVPQRMYIFKQARTGEVVNRHCSMASALRSTTYEVESVLSNYIYFYFSIVFTRVPDSTAIECILER